MSSFWSQRGHCLRLQRDRVFNLGKWSALLGSHSCGLSWDPITLPCPCFSTCEESTVSLQIHLLVTLCFLCLQNLCSWRFPTETDLHPRHLVRTSLQQLRGHTPDPKTSSCGQNMGTEEEGRGREEKTWMEGNMEKIKIWKEMKWKKWKEREGHMTQKFENHFNLYEELWTPILRSLLDIDETLNDVGSSPEGYSFKRAMAKSKSEWIMCKAGCSIAWGMDGKNGYM